MRHPKGTVVVCLRGGVLALRLPRHLYDGEQKYLYLGLPDTPTNREAAEHRARAISADIAFDQFDPTLERYKPTATQPDNSPLLSELWDKYVNYKSKTVRQITLNKDFKRIRNHISDLPSQRLRDARQIKNFLLNTMSAESAKKVLMQFSACCSWAVGEELISQNPFKNLPRITSGKKSGSINPFTKQERDLIIKSFEVHPVYRHYAPFVKFLFLTGCRTSEAIGLQWRHITPCLSYVTFSEALVQGRRGKTKTGTIRKFPVNSQLRSLLVEIEPKKCDLDDLVFKSPEGQAIDSHNFLNRAWKTILAELPIDYRPQYNTRHTFISLCLEAGVQVTQVAAWAGNSPRTIWQHYAGLVKHQDVPNFD